MGSLNSFSAAEAKTIAEPVFLDAEVYPVQAPLEIRPE
jgi:hypothetical protein